MELSRFAGHDLVHRLDDAQPSHPGTAGSIATMKAMSRKRARGEKQQNENQIEPNKTGKFCYRLGRIHNSVEVPRSALGVLDAAKFIRPEDNSEGPNRSSYLRGSAFIVYNPPKNLKLFIRVLLDRFGSRPTTSLPAYPGERTENCPV